MRLDAFRVSAIKDPFRLLDKPLVAADEKSACADGWIRNCEFRFATRVRLHHAYDRFNQNARRKVLAGAFLSFARGFLEQAFECRAFNIDIHRRPIFLVDHRDDALEIDRIVKARRRLRENVGKQSSRFTQLPKNVCVVIGQRGSR